MAAETPIDMVLHCPACGLQHIDAPEPGKIISDGPNSGRVRAGWDNPPHRSHLCHGCGHVWRPADVATNGVAAVLTKGKADSPIVPPGGCLESTNARLLELRAMADDAADRGDVFAQRVVKLLERT